MTPSLFLLDLLRLTLWLLLLIAVFVPLERIVSDHPRRIFRKSFAADLGYYFLSGLLPKLLLVLPLALVASLMRHLLPGALHSWVADLPLWARCVAALVVGEVGFYWGHRWTHEIPFLWRFHAIHHSAEEMDWLVNTRAHPFDIVFVRLCGFVPMYALGLAQPLGGTTVDTVPLLIMLVGTMWGFLIHANLPWRFGWLGLLISSPAFHHWHHTKDEHIDKNYASMLPWMDKLFGTWYLPKGELPKSYGTNAPVPTGLLGQMLYPFTMGEQEANVAAPVTDASPRTVLAP